MTAPPPGTVPTPEGKAFFFLMPVFVLAAFSLRDNLVLLLVALEFGCGVAAWPLARGNVRRVRVSRRIAGRAQAGRPVTVEYQVENPSKRAAIGIVVRDAPDSGARPQALEVAFGTIAAGGRASASSSITFDRRGLRRLRAPHCTSRFPLGLFSTTVEVGSAEVDVSSEILVRPREGKTTGALKARLAGETPATSRRSLSLAGVDRFHGLREFREGDDPRRVHWKTTARRGVKTFLEWRAEAGREVVIVLGRGETASPDADRRFERAVSVAATVLRSCVKSRLPARLLLGNPDVDRRAGLRITDGSGFEAALDALSTVKPQAGRRPRAALEAIARDKPARTLVWIGAAADTDVPERLERLAGRRGSYLHLRAESSTLARYVVGLP